MKQTLKMLNTSTPSQHTSKERNIVVTKLVPYDRRILFNPLLEDRS